MTNKIKGFTLIELLVAMSIFAAIAVVLYSCFRGGVVSYGRISEEADSQQRLRYVLLVMEKDFKNAFFMTNIPFEGDYKRISFTGMITEKENAVLNAGRISYYLKPGDNAYRLIRKIESLPEALTLIVSEYGTVEEMPKGAAAGKEEVIAEDISDIRFAYLYAENQQNILGAEEEVEDATISYEWVDLWEEEALPLAIRIEILFSDSSGIKPQQIIKRTWIPAAAPFSSKALEA
ncbi:MAG: prepilin-type N-terminal cleavage/methylation domain-containing protein [Dehalococcoidia bacterium]|nr:MAG: prepilin-type N-terminal cleavage/methylation domain-containing protein [Dehalococcoidia bacterium]